MGEEYLLSSIAVVVIGGTSVAGGFANVPGLWGASLFLFLLVAGLSGLAMPGLSTFVSEFLVLVGTFSRYQVAAALATFGIILSALYILIMYQRTMTGPTTPETEHTADVRGREAIVVAPLFVLLIALGVAPAPLLEPINDSTEQTLELVGVSDPEPVFAAEGGDQ